LSNKTLFHEVSQEDGTSLVSLADCAKLMLMLRVISARTFACLISVIEHGMSMKYTLNVV